MLEAIFETLRSEIDGSIEDFFEEAKRRLMAGEIRLVFLLDQAPHELQRLVGFLNRQMERTEVLLVEARLIGGNVLPQQRIHGSNLGCGELWAAVGP